MTVGKDIYAVGSCTQGLCNIPVNCYALLLACIFDILANTVLEVPVLVLEGSTLCEYIAGRCIDTYVDTSYACRGSNISCYLETDDKFLDVLNLLGSFPLLVAALGIDTCGIQLTGNFDLRGK
jgi:hypothetical protein